MLAGGIAGVINKGIIGDEESKSGGIKLENGGTLSSLGANEKENDLSVNPAILNMENGIIYGDTEISNGSKLLGGILNQDNASLIGDIKVSGANSQIIGG
ncbi:hypothetical protein, partial [Helicobacter burdigaliensis]